MIKARATPDPAETKRDGPSLSVMRLVAGGLLAAMAGLFVAGLKLEAVHPGWGYARAFAEAALVGGLADWFAVTALFRRPLGLPIPHTAIIPRSKGRIADALAEFVASNFLAPEVVAARLRDQDLAGALGKQIAAPATARRVADGIMDSLPGLISMVDDETVSAFLRRQIEEMSRDERLSAALGRGLRVLTEHGRHQPLLDAALAEGWKALEENEGAIRAQVRARTSWLWRLIALDARASDALISAIEDILQAMAQDRSHPARQRITAMLHKFSDELEHSPALRAHVERIVSEILAHPATNSYFAELWRSLRAATQEAPGDSPSSLRAALADAIARFGEALLADGEVRRALNARLVVLLSEIAGRHGRDAATLISDTIKGWDAKTVVAKLEQSVGPDLQYIRINGTLIGGLIGLAIHQISVLLR